MKIILINKIKRFNNLFKNFKIIRYNLLNIKILMS